MVARQEELGKVRTDKASCPRYKKPHLTTVA